MHLWIYPLCSPGHSRDLEPGHSCPTQDFSNRQSFLGNSPSAWIRLSQNCAATRGSCYPIFSPLPAQVLGLHHDEKALPICVSSRFNLHRYLPNKPLVYLIPSECLFLRRPKPTRWYGWWGFRTSPHLLAVKELPILSRMWDTCSPWHNMVAQFIKTSPVVSWGNALAKIQLVLSPLILWIHPVVISLVFKCKSGIDILELGPLTTTTLNPWLVG